jgi:hypothetical protein
MMAVDTPRKSKRTNPLDDHLLGNLTSTDELEGRFEKKEMMR